MNMSPWFYCRAITEDRNVLRFKARAKRLIGQYIDSTWILRQDIVLDFAYQTCCLFYVLKAALQFSDGMSFWNCDCFSLSTKKAHKVNHKVFWSKDIVIFGCMSFQGTRLFVKDFETHFVSVQTVLVSSPFINHSFKDFLIEMLCILIHPWFIPCVLQASINQIMFQIRNAVMFGKSH